MSQAMINMFYSIATGSSRKRALYTPLGAIIFITVTCIFIFLPLVIESALGIARIYYFPWNEIAGWLFIVAGVFFTVWSLIIFFMSKGTPVPFNPPPQLVVKGPYKFSRNPMTAGLFLQMFGLGIWLGSVLMTLVFVPLYVFLHTKQLKNVEEPELEKRLGAPYFEYKNKVPMFFSWGKMKV